MKKKNSNFKSGFTLIELIIVIAILGVLSAIALPSFSGFTQKAKTKTIITNIDNIEDACALYNATEGGWPKLGEYGGDLNGEFYNSSGVIVALDAGNYYKIDFAALNSLIDTPENPDNYILRNPIGKVYYKKDTGEVTDPDFVIKNGVLTGYTGAGGDIIIPDIVTSIADNVFNYDPSDDGHVGTSGIIESVTIPNTVKTIGKNAFRKSGLTSLTIKEGVEIIGDGAFYDNNLASVTIPEGVTSIGMYAFKYNSLTSVEIPGSVVYIKRDAFTGNSLTSLVIKEGVINIATSAFKNNQNLKNIIIGNNVAIYHNSFDDIIGSNFKVFYDGKNKLAGTYEHNGTKWIFTVAQ